MKIHFSPYNDPVLNLALEAYLRAETAGDHMLAYINDQCVVIGRNQCAEAEADIAYCRTNGIKVLRRISGGGTVYHDRGNINYSFIRSGDSSLSDGKLDLQLAIAALAHMGIEVAAGPRSELLYKGLKISGTASYCRGGRYIFHGTILYDTDLQKLARALDGDGEKRGGKIASVPSPVTNLRDHFPQIGTAPEFASAFLNAAAEITGGTISGPENPDMDKLHPYFPEIIG